MLILFFLFNTKQNSKNVFITICMSLLKYIFELVRVILLSPI
ncbi:hypothetical protein T190130A13A_60110 [Tenacibaculum sp. 190130A14a]|uniref:Uncharacterized protein n=1 Tax=Tenacibaculum polynesiense TaxID=3137857 RepID=A0ABM9PEX2_9FLAO